MNLLVNKTGSVKKHQLIFFIGIVMLLIVGNIFWHNLTTVVTPVPVLNKQQPEYFITSSNSQTFNTTGLKLHTLTSDYLEHINHSGNTTLIAPVINIYQQEGDLWTGKANTGTLFEVSPDSAQVSTKAEEFLYLQGDVVFHNVAENSNNKDANELINISSQSLKFFHNKDIISGKELITLAKGSSLIKAGGLELNLNNKHLLLTNQVKSSIFQRKQ